MGKPDVVVGIEAGSWDRLHDPQGLATRAAGAAWAGAAAAGAMPNEGRGAEIGVVLADDALVHRLNRDYRGKDRPTNVLSFPLLDEEGGFHEGEDVTILLGDVVLAFETVAGEAREQGKTLEVHVTHLIVHGVLHLLGYDHETDEDADRMERLEARILGGLGIADPYAGPVRTEPQPERR